MRQPLIAVAWRAQAEVDGTVVKLVAENGSPVTPGQALIIIKP